MEIFCPFPEIQPVIEKIIQLISPKKVLLFHAKGLERPVSFKLCIIQDALSREALERLVYIHVDSDIPFDVVTYTSQDWEQLSQQQGSFANRILQIGSVVYG